MAGEYEIIYYEHKEHKSGPVFKLMPNGISYAPFDFMRKPHCYTFLKMDPEGSFEFENELVKFSKEVKPIGRVLAECPLLSSVENLEELKNDVKWWRDQAFIPMAEEPKIEPKKKFSISNLFNFRRKGGK